MAKYVIRGKCKFYVIWSRSCSVISLIAVISSRLRRRGGWKKTEITPSSLICLIPCRQPARQRKVCVPRTEHFRYKSVKSPICHLGNKSDPGNWSFIWKMNRQNNSDGVFWALWYQQASRNLQGWTDLASLSCIKQSAIPICDAACQHEGKSINDHRHLMRLPELEPMTSLQRVSKWTWEISSGEDDNLNRVYKGLHEKDCDL